MLNLKIADVVKDGATLVKARNAAIGLLQEDANLSKPENKGILTTFTAIYKSTGIWANIS